MRAERRWLPSAKACGSKPDPRSNPESFHADVLFGVEWQMRKAATPNGEPLPSEIPFPGFPDPSNRGSILGGIGLSPRPSNHADGDPDEGHRNTRPFRNDGSTSPEFDLENAHYGLLRGIRGIDPA
jgi:hypothetical protein